ncbi:MAG: metallophosphoesterase [Clostridia bacterium]|nr:metallophosphoesterase [Clostridia bacterium]
MSTVRCLVISDSHGRADRLSQVIKRAGNIDALFFLGDGLSDLANAISGTPPFSVIAVKGNCDFGNPLPDRNVYKIDSITLAEHKIVLTHGDLYGAKYGLDGLIAFAKNMSADVLLYGHTHEPCEDYIDGTYYLNPGSLKGDRALPTAGILTVGEKGVLFSLMEL